MLQGLRDADVIACITHGFKRNSAAAAPQLNPVDAVFRMAADMSGCFTSSRVNIRGLFVKSKSHTLPALYKSKRYAAGVCFFACPVTGTRDRRLPQVHHRELGGVQVVRGDGERRARQAARGCGVG